MNSQTTPPLPPLLPPPTHYDPNHTNLSYPHDDNSSELSVSDFEFLNLSESDDLSSNQETSSRLFNQNNHQFVDIFRQYPHLTPAKLAIIVNFENENHLNNSDYSDQKNKKRIRAPLTDEEKLKRNLKRKKSPRIFKYDIRRQYMNMLVNVLNSADLNLFKQFIDKYFHPDFVYTKSMISQNNQMPLGRYQSSGTENLCKFFAILLEASPDFIFNLHDTRICFNSKTNQTILIGNLKHLNTRKKFHQNIFLVFLSQMRSLSEKYFQSLFLDKSHSIPSETLTSTSTLSFDKMILDETIYSEEQAGEITVENCLSPYVKDMTPVNIEFSYQIMNTFCNLDFYQCVKSSLSLNTTSRSNSLISLTSFFPGIKVDSQCIFRLYLNEQHQVIKFDVLVGKTILKMSSSDDSTNAR